MTISAMLFESSADLVSIDSGIRAKIGNKAIGLIRLQHFAAKVPPWISLTPAFFKSWQKEIENIVPNSQLHHPLDAESRKALDAALKKLQYSTAQLDVLAELSARLGESAYGYAVRSSAQNEDTQGQSFAGIYKSLLGVSGNELEHAVLQCYISNYSDAALEYATKNSVIDATINFSLIVQHQIPCDVSGIGFSIHPLNNHYDIVYLNANFGLGESIASGLGDPDSFEVNKLTLTLLKSHCGNKKHRSVIGANNEIVSIDSPTSESLSLSDEQVIELTRLTTRIEKLFGKPVEIEWGIVNAEIYLFQVRPVTSWVPIPREMQTGENEKPVLYLDRALSDGMTMNKAASPLGLDIIRKIEMSLYEKYIGSINKSMPPTDSLLFHTGGRVYANLSVVLCLSSPDKLVKTLEPLNAQLSQILGNVDLSNYLPKHKPGYLKAWKIRLLPLIVWRARTIIGKIRRGSRNPAELREEYDRQTTAYKDNLANLEGRQLPYPDFVLTVQHQILEILANTFIPALIVINSGASKKLDKLFSNPSAEEKLLIDNFRKGFADNLVVAMGRNLHSLGVMLRTSGIDSAGAALQTLGQESIDPCLSEPLDAYLNEFGHRGPNEMDISQARYSDDLELLVSQALAISSSDLKPEQPADQGASQNMSRAEAYDKLKGKLNNRQARELEKIQDIYNVFGAMRDTPKHFILFGLQKIRQRTLEEGEALVTQNRLDAANDIFYLSFEQVSSPDSDLRTLVKRSKEFYDLQSLSIREFPTIIDSRGYIPANDQLATASQGALQGVPVSPGIARGQVKILNEESKTTVTSSDILVAYVTDPGLTPNFTNAAGIVLEVGGVLQHGAVVARELGIPCVTSILGATKLLKAGDFVEVDGSNGNVRILSQQAEQSSVV